MKEIGGYLEYEENSSEMLYSDAIHLNCAKNCLVYLIKARDIKKIYIPYFLCDVVEKACEQCNVIVEKYNVDCNFIPNELPNGDDWIYIVNYYGQIDNVCISEYKKKHKNIIVDNVQAYFQRPLKGVDTLYSCRKFFGVADGAILYTDAVYNGKIEEDESYDRMRFVLGRYEKNASEFYCDYKNNNKLLEKENIKAMSKLTKNILRGIDYDSVIKKRTDNFRFLNNKLSVYNKLNIKNIEGAFMFPFMVDNASELRNILIANKIYVPILWPNVIEETESDTLEYKMAENILPLPCDHRYGIEEMNYIVNIIKKWFMERK